MQTNNTIFFLLQYDFSSSIHNELYLVIFLRNIATD